MGKITKYLSLQLPMGQDINLRPLQQEADVLNHLTVTSDVTNLLSYKDG